MRRSGAAAAGCEADVMLLRRCCDVLRCMLVSVVEGDRVPVALQKEFAAFLAIPDKSRKHVWAVTGCRMSELARGKPLLWGGRLLLG